MQFSTDVLSLRDAIAATRPALTATPTLHAHAAVRIVAEGSNVSVSATDGDTTIVAKCEANVVEEGELFVVPKHPASWLAALPATTPIDVTYVPGEDLSITPKGYAAYSFRTLATTLPPPPEPKSPLRPADFTRFAEALASVRTAAPRDGGGVHLLSSGTTLALRATDNYRLHSAVLEGAGFGDFDGVVTASMLDQVAQHDIEAVSFDPRTRTMWFMAPKIRIATRLLAVPFPPVDELLSLAYGTKVQMSKPALTDALRRLASVTETAPVVVSIVDGTAEISCSDPEVGSACERVPATVEGPQPVTFAALRGFLADAVAAHRSDTVTLGWDSPSSRVVLHSEKPHPTITVTMPIVLEDKENDV